MSFAPTATPGGRTQRQTAIRKACDTLPSDADMRHNLLTTLADADDASQAEGLAWYLSAHSIAADLAVTHGYAVRQTAGVIAALSPQTGWADNVRLATNACEHAANGRTDLIGGHTTDACRKASIILQGEDPADVLGGRKVRSFFANIARPTTPGPVTVDRHCVDMLAGQRGYVSSRILERIGTYTRCAAVVRSVARELGYRPHELQAIAWVGWRKTHDVAYRFDLTDDNGLPNF